MKRARRKVRQLIHEDPALEVRHQGKFLLSKLEQTERSTNVALTVYGLNQLTKKQSKRLIHHSLR